jgi:predicted nicotinamide N-methyase
VLVFIPKGAQIIGLDVLLSGAAYYFGLEPAGLVFNVLLGYAVKQESIFVTGVENLQIRSLLDRHQFFDPADEAENLGISCAAWPIFGLLWPSARQLAARLAQRPVNSLERILEIGCGLALTSIVAHRRGANITASDCHPLAAGFLQCNLRLNGLPTMPYLHGQWGSTAPPGDLAERYGLIVGSDVLYERDAKGELAKYIAAQVAPVAEVWIIDPDRSNRSAFSQRMLALGFSLTEERLDSAATENNAAYKGRLITYHRSG